jgi:hypothetical protein
MTTGKSEEVLADIDNSASTSFLHERTPESPVSQVRIKIS